MLLFTIHCVHIFLKISQYLTIQFFFFFFNLNSEFISQPFWLFSSKCRIARYKLRIVIYKLSSEKKSWIAWYELRIVRYKCTITYWPISKEYSSCREYKSSIFFFLIHNKFVLYWFSTIIRSFSIYHIIWYCIFNSASPFYLFLHVQWHYLMLT